MHARICIAPRFYPDQDEGFGCSIAVDGRTVASAWRISPELAYRDAQRLAGVSGAYCIPRSVDVRPLYKGAAIRFTDTLT